MSELLFKNFTKTTLEERKLILSWRNSDRIRLKMVNREIIPLENHLKFIEGLKDRTDCVYWLIYIDETPVGAAYDTDINLSDNTRSGGMYIGDEEYTGYGIPILYYGYQNYFENIGIKENVFDVLKTNKRIYQMHKKIFHARDKYETDKEWFLYHDMETYREMKADLEPKMKSFYNIDLVTRM